MCLLPGLLAYSEAALSAPNSGRELLLGLVYSNRRQADPTDGGVFGFSGVVSIAGAPDQPVSRKVALFCETSRRLVRETWSGADGTYSFEGIRHGPWFVVAFDHTDAYNAVCVTGVDLPLVGNDGINLRFGDTCSSINYYNGSTWVSGRLKRWDGANWVLV